MKPTFLLAMMSAAMLTNATGNFSMIETNPSNKLPTICTLPMPPTSPISLNRKPAPHRLSLKGNNIWEGCFVYQNLSLTLSAQKNSVTQITLKAIA